MQAYIDIGGTNLRYELEENGTLLEQNVISSRETEFVSFIEQLAEKHPLNFIGISFAGPVYDGEILMAPNINIQKINIRDHFKEKYGIRLEINNDVKCAALAEYAMRPEAQMLLALYPGTGFGAGFVNEGKLIAGCKNYAGEIGHVPFKEAPIACGCGKTNCIEIYSSGSGLEKWVEYYKLEIPPTLAALKESDSPHAKEILDNFHQGLMHAVGIAVTALNPDYVILGGGVIMRNHYLLEYINEHLCTYAMKGQAQSVKIALSEISDAPMRGTRQLR